MLLTSLIVTAFEFKFVVGTEISILKSLLYKTSDCCHGSMGRASTFSAIRKQLLASPDNRLLEITSYLVL